VFLQFTQFSIKFLKNLKRHYFIIYVVAATKGNQSPADPKGWSWATTLPKVAALQPKGLQLLQAEHF